jgi:hypothetical protein
MTNFDRWKLYMRDIASPELFIEWGYYSMVGAALERRVANSNPDRPLFTNPYVVLVGPPGIGKGLVTDTISDWLNFHKVPRQMSKAEAAVAEGSEKSVLVPRFSFVGDSITYEKMMDEVVLATRDYVDHNGRTQIQASLIMVLDEFTSIFKKHADDIVVYCNTAWNGKNYDRKTKKGGTVPIRKPILSIIGGTTPSELQKLRRLEVAGGGFFSRFVFVYSSLNRMRVTRIPPPDTEQAAAKNELLDYLLTLSKVSATIGLSDEAQAYLDVWYKDENNVVLNRDVRLGEYYARKITHITKLAMMMHFAEPGWGKEISIDTLKMAIDLLGRTEKNMHLALSASGRNALSAIATDIMAYLQKVGQADYRELLAQFYSECTGDELNDILQTLQAQHKINSDRRGEKTVYKLVE